MHIDPLIVVLGAALCLIPVGFGVLIASWRLPYVDEEGDSLTDMVLGGDEELTWRRWRTREECEEPMRDEGDLHANVLIFPPKDYDDRPRRG